MSAPLSRREVALVFGEVIQALVAMSSEPDGDGGIAVDSRNVRQAVQLLVMLGRGDLGGADAERDEFQQLADRGDDVSVSTGIICALAAALGHVAHDRDVAQVLRWYAEEDELWDEVCRDLERQNEAGLVVAPGTP